MILEEEKNPKNPSWNTYFSSFIKLICPLLYF